MNSSSIRKCIVSAALAAAIAGCASQRPVLYPNAKYKQVGEAAARQDVDECIRLAEQAGAPQDGGERAVQSGAEGAAVGGAAGKPASGLPCDGARTRAPR